jgi:quinol monooxygenase YgiN
MTSHQAESQREPLCLQFDWGVSTEDPDVFYIHEEYAGEKDGKEGLDAHQRSAHFARFMKFNLEKQPYSKPQVLHFFNSVKV